MLTTAQKILIFSDDRDAYDWRAKAFASQAGVGQRTYRALNRCLRDFKTTGIWPKLNRLNLFCGDSLTACLIPQKVGAGSATDTNVNFVSGDYAESTGLTGNGSSKYLNTGFNPVAAGSSLSSFGMFVYVSGTESAGTSRILMGNQSSGSSLSFVGWAASGTVEVGCIGVASSAEYAPSGVSAGKQGFLGVVANGSRSQQYYHNGAAVGAPVTSSGSFFNGNIYVGATNSSGSPAAYTARPIRAYLIVTGMSAVEIAALNQIVEAFQDALGRGVQ